MQPISEEILRRLASIVGPHSAAADALRDAESRRARGEHVEFFKDRNSIIVRGSTPATEKGE